MKILVTGSDGFIGCHLTALLVAKGHQVEGIDTNKSLVPAWLRRERKKWSSIHSTDCDIRDLRSLIETIAQASPDVVIHLAAKPGVAGAEQDPESYDAVNVRGVANLVNACRVSNVKRIVHASSSSVYGDAVGKIMENSQLRPMGHYGTTKVRGEQLLQDASKDGDIDVLILRPFSVVGARGRPDMAPWRFAEALRADEEIQVHAGAGRDFTAVEDVARAFALAAEADTKGCHMVNIGGGEPHLASELAERLANSLGRRCRMKPSPLPIYMPVSTHADIAQARSLLGWKPEVSFEQAVADFGEWYVRAHRDV